MKALALVPLAALLLAATGAAGQDRCRPADGKASRRDCPPPRKFEPYDPDRPKPGRTPGFIDLGNGTEVRVGGRVRMDYDVRR